MYCFIVIWMCCALTVPVDRFVRKVCGTVLELLIFRLFRFSCWSALNRVVSLSWSLRVLREIAPRFGGDCSYGNAFPRADPLLT